MPYNWDVGSHRRYPVKLKVTGTLATGDDKAMSEPMPFMSGRLVGVLIAVRDNGNTGQTDVTFEKHRDNAAVGDLLSAAMSIQHDASENHAEVGSAGLSTTQGMTLLEKGDTIMMNIDAIPSGTASEMLSAVLIVHVDVD
jgi:hypothetical protein